MAFAISFKSSQHTVYCLFQSLGVSATSFSETHIWETYFWETYFINSRDNCNLCFENFVNGTIRDGFYFDTLSYSAYLVNLISVLKSPFWIQGNPKQDIFQSHVSNLNTFTKDKFKTMGTWLCKIVFTESHGNCRRVLTLSNLTASFLTLLKELLPLSADAVMDFTRASSIFQVRYLGSLFGFLIRVPYLDSLFGFLIWVPHLGSLFGFLIQVPYLGSLFGFHIWGPYLGSFSHIGYCINHDKAFIAATGDLFKTVLSLSLPSPLTRSYYDCG